MNRYSPPTGFAGFIYSILWWYFFGIVLDQFFGGRQHPRFLHGYYVTVLTIYGVSVLALMIWWLAARWKKRQVK